MTLPWPDRLLTLDDWAALPPDPSRRLELVEGVLVAAPRPALLHQLALGRLVAAVQDQLPVGLVAVGEVEIVVDPGATAAGAAVGQTTGPATVRVPDVIVVPAAVAEQNPARVAAADVLVAVEIVSPGDNVGCGASEPPPGTRSGPSVRNATPVAVHGKGLG